MRGKTEVLVFVSLTKLRQDGHATWMSAHGIILCSGVHGVIPPCYISHLSSVRGEYSGKIWLNPLFHGPRTMNISDGVSHSVVVDPRLCFYRKC